jgi:carbamoyltransferase
MASGDKNELPVRTFRYAVCVAGPRQMSKIIVLGLNCAHDAAACLVIDGRIVGAIAEERLTRRKHQVGFPRLAIDYCLRLAGLTRNDFDPTLVVMNYAPPADFEGQALKAFGHLSPDRVIVNPSHHLLHACYVRAIAVEGDPISILIADGSGYSYCEHERRQSPLLGQRPEYADAHEALSAYYIDHHDRMSLILKDWGCWRDFPSLRFPSLGHMYGSAAKMIFGSWTHAGKVMGLAPFGDPAGIEIGPIVTLHDEGIAVDTDWMLSLPPIPALTRFEDSVLARNLAAKVQAELEKAMFHLVTVLYSRTKCDTLGLSGGVALNSVCNGMIAHEGPFRRLVITPAAHDSGTAVGAAAYGCHVLTNRYPAVDGNSDYWGMEYGEDEILRVINANQDLKWTKVNSPENGAAEDLAAGQIVGWFESKSEFGPRALGHRSILADPRDCRVRTILNERIKFRESFRPYAASVLARECSEWFSQVVPSPHMLMVATARKGYRDRIPAVVHVDQTCRLQTIGDEYSGGLKKIVERFFALTGIPLVLNTSLNVHGEPIAETPQDAVDCLRRSGLEIVYIGGYKVSSVHPWLGEFDETSTVAEATSEFRLVCHFSKTDASGVRVRYCLVHQGGRTLGITTRQAEILLVCRYGQTIGDLCAALPTHSSADIRQEINALCNLGLMCLKFRVKSTEN